MSSPIPSKSEHHSYHLVRVSHTNILQNSTSKESYQPIVEVLYVHPDSDKCRIKFLDIIKDYTPDKYLVVNKGDLSCQVYDTSPIPGWVVNGRKKLLLFTITVLDYLHSS
jgi:hypothetical protein